MILPDILDHNLKIVFCGTAAGTKSANIGCYYAGRGNKFWRTLYEIGLTDRILAPDEFQTLFSYGIGLTDLAKHSSGMDRNLAGSDFHVSSFKRKIQKYQPKLLCFNGKKAAKIYFQRKWIEHGVQNDTIGTTKFYVLPSTSAANNKNWDIIYWHEVAGYSGVK